METFLGAYAKKDGAEPDKSSAYLAANVALKDGGKHQTLVWLSGKHWCGDGGCPLLVLEKDGPTYRLVAEVGQVWTPVRVLQSQHNGWNDISVSVLEAGSSDLCEAPLTFDGKTYSAPPTREAAKSFSPEESAVLGQPSDVPLPLYP